MGSSGRDGRSLRVLAVEPYYGGSHRAFLDGLAGASGHEFRLLTMPARKWKWRMRGSAMWCVQELAEKGLDDFDLILTSDMMPVADLRALLPRRWAGRPIVCYFHENQLTYPLSPEDTPDYQYGFTNITSCLAADQVWFNSAYHLRTFLNAARERLKEMPDCVPTGVAERIEAKSTVMHPGIDLAGLDPAAGREWNKPPVILWNHRWEYDKAPDTFFRALFSLAEARVDFRLVVAGERFRTWPSVFDQARQKLAAHIDHFGHYQSTAEYRHVLGRADLVVSTAVHEFFGLAVVEAMAAGCFPVLPDRLSYPELLPAELHSLALYQRDDELAARLGVLLASPPEVSHSRALATQARRFGWETRVAEFDAALKQAVGRRLAVEQP